MALVFFEKGALAFFEKGFQRVDTNFGNLWNPPLWCGVADQSKGGDALGVGDFRVTADSPALCRRTVCRST